MILSNMVNKTEKPKVTADEVLEDVRGTGKIRTENTGTTAEQPQKVVLEDPNQVLLDRIAQLEKRDKENQEKLRMLEDVADKGRLLSYQTRKSNKQPMRAHLALYKDQYVVGWRTVKDKLISHPTTGATVGEEQEYELILLDAKGNMNKETVVGYPQFSEIRYADRVECDIVGKKEDFEGNLSFDVVLPDGRQIELAGQFLN